jgi:hypothetical protein
MLQHLILMSILLGITGIAFVFLGPFGIVLVGLFTMFVCTSGELRENNPSIGFYRSPEQRAAMAEERLSSVAPHKLYRWCGIGLLFIGIIAFLWDQS